ncbi:MAG: hypothetical protein ACFFA6_04075 [Promethearchaeota archaeon]
MGKQTPSRIYKSYKQKKITQNKLIEDLLTICEHSDSKANRLECLEIIDLVGGTAENIFKNLEELTLSDTDMDVRIKAIEYIIKKFPDRGLLLVKYLIEESISLEFVINLCKIIGETIFILKIELSDDYMDYLRQVMLRIFELEDTSSFELLWGDWFKNTPNEFWHFMTNLENPIGFLEILESNLDNNEFFSWFYNYLITQFNIARWIDFFNNPKFSGHLLNILKYLGEENPPLRFYQIIDFFMKIGEFLTKNQQERILKILRKNNLFDLSLLIVFNWFKNFNNEILREFIRDPNYNLNLKLSVIIESSRFGFLSHENFFYFLIRILYRIYEDFDKIYFQHVYDHLNPNIREQFLSKLFEIANSSENSQLSIKNKYHKNYKILAYKILKHLLEKYELKKNLCNQL